MIMEVDIVAKVQQANVPQPCNFRQRTEDQRSDVQDTMIAVSMFEVVARGKGEDKCEEMGVDVRKQEMAAPKKFGFVPGGGGPEEGSVNGMFSEDQLDVLQCHGEGALHIVIQSIHETMLPAGTPS